MLSCRALSPLAALLLLAACPCRDGAQGSFCYHPPESAGTESGTSSDTVVTTGDTTESETTASGTMSMAETMMTEPDECGNGVVEGDEVCDEGADNSEYADGPGMCNLSCSGDAPYCGDGMCQTSDEDANVCEDCTPMCNNGVVEGDEACDDGNLVNADECLNNCTLAECGDGVQWEGMEACDDGNGVETDSCLSSCTPATCGDMVTQIGVEECDDGNPSDVDGCDGACKLVEHRKVFVTAGNYQGGLGGLAGADTKCGMEQGSLMGEFKAWLSDGTTGPADRFDTAFTGVYELADGTMVAHGWSELTTIPLAHAIDQEADGTPTMSTLSVWTNTKTDGTSAGSVHCADWMNSQFASEGVIGLSDQTTDQWTNAAADECNGENYLYCFEDPR